MSTELDPGAERREGSIPEGGTPWVIGLVGISEVLAPDIQVSGALTCHFQSRIGSVLMDPAFDHFHDDAVWIGPRLERAGGVDQFQGFG